MGSRRSFSFQEYSTRPARSASSLADAIEHKSVNIAVATAIDVIALSSPPIATLVTAYHVAKTLNRVVQASYETYERTGDGGLALASGAKEVLRAGVTEMRSQTIGSTVDMTWGAVKVVSRVTTSPVEDKILTSAVKNAVEEIMPRDKA
jgi:hypothetical protein